MVSLIKSTVQGGIHTEVENWIIKLKVEKKIHSVVKRQGLG